MHRTHRAELAKKTVEIVERGSYLSEHDESVTIRESVEACLQGTRIYEPAELESLKLTILSQPGNGAAQLEVVNETTLAGIARILKTDGEGGPPAALNFASARNPGGGFLNGSQAQEESLARGSALYASQMRAWDFYERHRAAPSLLYSDAMIFSPGCPIIRDDRGALLDRPHQASFITSPAPNAGAIAQRQPRHAAEIPGVLHRRSEFILALAASVGCRRIVLGAWGCGVFMNDPDQVARTFAAHLRHGPWLAHFDRVVFSVYDHRPQEPTLKAFRNALG